MKKPLSFLLSLFLVTQLKSQSGSQVFTASGNFLVPPSVTSITVEVVGAGGSGAGNGGGGGGGGGYAAGVYAVTPGASIPVTIGVGGSGSVGGTTSLGSFISATGGANGTTVSNPNIGGGGAGGTGVNGTIVNRTGGTGGGGYWTYFGGGGAGAGGSISNGANGGNSISYSPGFCLTPGGSGGAGGGAPGGNGGKGAGFIDNSCNGADPAAAGSSYGGGGGGGNGNSSPFAVGANGYCSISWGCAAPSAPVNTTPGANLTICSLTSATLQATSSGTVVWYTSSSGTGSIGTGTSIVTPPLTTGTLTFYAEALTCTNSVVRTPVTVTVNPSPTILANSASLTICSGQQSVLNAAGGTSYTWSPYNAAVMTQSTGATTTVSPLTSNGFTVYGTGVNGCIGSGTINILVNPTPTVTVVALTPSVCNGATTTLIAGGAANYGWAQVGPNTPTLTSPNVCIIKPIASTIYTVIGFSAAFCSALATVAVGVNPLPVLNVSSSHPIMCRNFGTSNLTVIGAVTYTWNTGATTNVISTGTLSTATNFTVFGTDANGCQNTLVYLQIVAICDGINEQELFTVSPNPNFGDVTIRGDKELELKLSDALGRFVKNISLNPQNGFTVKLTGLTQGIYYIGGIDSQSAGKKIVVGN